MYAGDLARVIKEVLDKDITHSFNVAVSENLTIHNMAHTALKTLKKDLKIQWSEPELNGQFRKDVCNKKRLSYIPTFKFTSFEEGIKKVYNKI